MSELSELRLPREVWRYVDNIRDAYTNNPALKAWNIAHMYPEDIAYPDGFHDARWFKLVVFNTETMERASLGKHDKIDIWSGAVKDIRIFADGSTLVRFSQKMEHIMNTQAISIREADGDSNKN